MEIKESKLSPIIIGDGDKIIKQYPNENVILNQGSKIFLVTNYNTVKMQDITGWSRNEIDTYAKLINLNVTFNGFGYAKEYSINKNSIIDTSKILEVTLEPKYTEEKEEDQDKKDDKNSQ